MHPCARTAAPTAVRGCPRLAAAVLLLAVVLLPASAAAGDLVGDFTPAFCTSSLPTDNKPPRIAGPLYDGASVVRIHNQVPGATLLVFSEQDGIILGPVPTKDASAFAIPARSAGDALWACQTGTMNSVCGLAVPVETPAASLPRPYLPHELVQGAYAVQVARVEPGSMVVVRDGTGAVVGQRFAATKTSVAVPIDPTIPAWSLLTITQEIGTLVSPETRVLVLPSLGLVTPSAPRILGPLETGDLAVWVSGVTPGSRVEIVKWPNTVVATADVGESVAKIPTCGIDGLLVHARATRNGASAEGALRGFFPWRSPETIRDEAWWIDTITLTDGTEADVIMHTWYPVAAEPDAPIAFFVHGVPPNSLTNTPSDSHHGYEYLAEELAALGIYVVSVSLVSPVGGGTLGVDEQDRALALDAVIDWTVAAVPEITASSRAVLVGHSTGGQAVLLSSERPQPLDVVGVVALSPTSADIDDHDVAARPDALFVKGSHDYFYPQAAEHLRSEYQYDISWQDRTSVLIEGAGHWEFNTVWSTAERDGDMSTFEQEALTSLLVVPWVYGHAYNVYGMLRGYYQGTVRRRGLNLPEMTFQHASPNVHMVIDDFGAGNGEDPIPDSNTNEALNAQGGAVHQTNAAADVLEAYHDDLPDHLSGYEPRHLDDDRAAVLEWQQRGYVYTSELPVPPSVDLDDVLTFRVMQHADSALNYPHTAQDLMVGLSDGVRTAYVRAGSQGEVVSPYENDDPSLELLQVFQTVRIPIDAFVAMRPSLDISAIERVEIRPHVRNSGVVLIDDLAFSD